MNGRILFSIASTLVLTPLSHQAAILVHWDFNSRPADNQSSTGTLMPAEGVGVAWPLGDINSAFAAGSPNDSAPDDTAWNTSSYPTQGTANKTSGIELAAPTTGHTNIALHLEIRATGTASRYVRLQCATNGMDFVDLNVLELPEASVFIPFDLSLANVMGADNNPALVLRLATEFESTATGSGPDQYATPSGGNYSSSGAFRFDLATLTGDPVSPENTPPRIEAVPDQTTVEDMGVGPFEVILEDAQTPNDELLLAVKSFNLALAPLEGITIGITESGRTLQIQPAAGQTGTAIIVLTVLDADGAGSSTEFVLTVKPANAAPSLSFIPLQTSLINEPSSAIAFTIDDLETPPDMLNVEVSSSNPNLTGTLTLGGGGSQRSLVLTPAANQSGTAAITVLVSDGHSDTRQTFVWMVLPQADLLVSDTFGYGAGPLVTNAPTWWLHHAGTAGDMEIDSEGLLLSTSETEDVHLDLPGGPYPPEEGTVLFVSFRLRAAQLPSPAGQYFAHLNTSSFRARVFITTETAGPGFFRLGIANSGAVPTIAPNDLSLDQEYVVVVGYDTLTGSTTLWIDPATASDSSVAAEDSPNPGTIVSFAFRQQTGIGRLKITELRIGTAFEQVLPSLSVSLRIRFASDKVELSWPAAAADWRLQTSPTIDGGQWSDIPSPPTPPGDPRVVELPIDDATQFFRLHQP